MKINDIVDALETIAPLRLAGGWDNVGLILQGDRPVQRAMVTIDLNDAVASEAIEAGVDLLIAYHPPIFSGMKRLTSMSSHGDALLRMLRAGVHVYSPHTALDATTDGINDWLLQGFEGVSNVHPITPDKQTPHVGAGRTCHISPTPLGSIITRLKSHLRISHMRLSGDVKRVIESVAVCPGSGGSLFKSMGLGHGVDLLLTGEMSHHDVLHQREQGAAVLICEHTHTERGFLPTFARRLSALCDGLPVLVSTQDQDPLRVV